MRNLIRFGFLLALAASTAACGSPDTPAGAPGTARGGSPLQPGAAIRFGPPARPGIDGPLATTQPDTPATPFTAAPPVLVTTAELMARGTGSVDRENRPRLTKIRPDRRLLLDNPDAPAVAQWPPSPRFRQGGTLAAVTPTTPNADIAVRLDTGNATPPDTMGDVGPTQYLVALNGRVRTISKATGLADGVLNLDSDVFYASVNDGQSTGDPRVRYDRRAGRWYVLMFTIAVPNRYVLAVSDSATITAGTTWAFHFWANTRTEGGVGGADPCLGDYPTLGIDEDALYIGVNQFCGADLNTVSFDSTSAYVLNRANLLAGTLTVFAFDGVLPSGASAGPYTPQGVDNFDSSTNQGYIIGVDNQFFSRLALRRVNDPAGSPTLSADVFITVPTTTFPTPVPHPGTAFQLDGLDDRLLHGVIRNGRLWTLHQIEVDTLGVANATGNRNGQRWYEFSNLTGTPNLVQSGTVFDPSATNPVSHWMGSIMVNGQGHVALGMTQAGATTRINTEVTGRLATAPPGTMEAPVVYSNNTLVDYTLTLGGNPQRWGDYSYTSVDPDDDMTMWTLQEYPNSATSFTVRLVRLLAPPPSAIDSLTPNSLGSGLTGATVTVDGTSSAGSGFFDPGPGFAKRLVAAFSGSGVVVTNVAFTSPTSLTLTVNTLGAPTGPRTLTVTNPDGQTAQLTSALTITAASNLAPSAGNDAFITLAGTPLNVAAPGVLANDTDPEGQPLTAQLVSNPASGAITLNPNGSFTYTPTAGFSGGDSFTYRASDGVLTSTAATVGITVSAANQAPVFGNVPSNQSLADPGSGVSSGPLAFSVTDPDGNDVSVSAGSSNVAVVPASGVVLGHSGSSRTVTISTVGATSLGTTTITLTASDGFLTSQASFTVTVTSPAPRTLIAVTARNLVQFTWLPPSAPDPVLAYVLEAGFTTGTTAVSVPLGPVLGFATAAPDGVYFVRVRAVTAAGTGPASNEVRVALGQAAPPLAPVALLATVQNRLVTLQWTENPLGPVITSYQIQAGTATGITDIGVIPLAATARTFSLTAPPGTYFVRLVAANSSGASGPSNEAVLTPGAGVCTIPAVPLGLQAASAAGVINVRWNAPLAGAIPLIYVVQAGSVTGGADRGTFTFPSSLTAVGGAVPPGPYFIRIAAANACGTSAPSLEVSTTVP